MCTVTVCSIVRASTILNVLVSFSCLLCGWPAVSSRV
jgi:hypothetical protein